MTPKQIFQNTELHKVARHAFVAKTIAIKTTLLGGNYARLYRPYLADVGNRKAPGTFLAFLEIAWWRLAKKFPIIDFFAIIVNLLHVGKCLDFYVQAAINSKGYAIQSIDNNFYETCGSTVALQEIGPLSSINLVQ